MLKTALLILFLAYYDSKPILPDVLHSTIDIRVSIYDSTDKVLVLPTVPFQSMHSKCIHSLWPHAVA